MILDLHPEDIKAALRKRYGSIRAFEVVAGLPDKSVHEIFRGRGSRRVIAAVENALSTDECPSSSSDRSSQRPKPHRLNQRAA